MIDGRTAMSDASTAESSETSSPPGSGEGTARSRRKRRRVPLLIAVAAVLESLPLWLRGYKRPGDVVVRCRAGHLFTTIWIPGASLKAARLGPWRFQRCPVGSHWTWVTPVNRAELTGRELRRADKNRDIRIP
jgi:hypothetical protein